MAPPPPNYACQALLNALDRYWVFPRLVAAGSPDSDGQRFLFVCLLENATYQIATQGSALNPAFLQSAATRFPFPPSSFHAVFVLELSARRNDDQRMSCIRDEAARVLCPEGTLFLGSESFWSHRWAHKRFRGAGNNTARTRGVSFGNNRRNWFTALGAVFTPVLEYYVHPSLWKPAIIFTTPDVFRQDGHIGFFRLLNQWKLLLAKGLTIIGFSEQLRWRFASITAWRRSGLTYKPPRLGNKVVLHTGKLRKANAVVGGENQPMGFVKFSRDDDHLLVAEQEVLHKVRHILKDSPLLQSIPEWWSYSRGMFTYQHRAGSPLGVILEPLIQRGRSRRAERLLRIAIDWLVEFQQTTSNDWRLERRSDSRALWLGPTHGDFTSYNIIIGPHNEISVIDWEDFEETQHPVFDMLKLVTHLGFAHRSLTYRFEEKCRNLFFVRGPLGHLIQRSIGHYCASMSVDPSALKRAYPAFAQQRLERRIEKGRPNEGHYLVDVKRFYEDNYDGISLFDL